MEKPPAVEIRIPSATLFKVFVAVLLVGIAARLAPLFLLLFLSTLLAVTLAPVLRWLQKKRTPRWLGILFLVVSMAALIGVFFAVVLPAVADQLSNFVKELPKYREQILRQIPPGSVLHKPATKLLNGDGLTIQSSWIEKFLSAGQFLAGGVAEILLVLILSIYLVVDGPRVFAWLLAFFSPLHRKKIRDTADGISEVIFAYVAGQLITSLLVFVFTMIAMRLLRVPAAMTLAVLAGVMDILPVLGFFLSAGPAVLLALTVSPTAALLALAYFVAYHAAENYFIVPKVYGNRLRLSTLSVLLSLLAADMIAGIGGAIAVLPLVASYPIIERIWLVPYLGQSTVEKHREQDERESA
jgi:predicted PurR-regulated permease PerM